MKRAHYTTLSNSILFERLFFSEHGFPKLVNAVKEKGIKGIDVGFPVPWGIKGYFNAYLHKPDDGPLKGKKLLRIFLNESFPNPGW